MRGLQVAGSPGCSWESRSQKMAPGLHAALFALQLSVGWGSRPLPWGSATGGAGVRLQVPVKRWLPKVDIGRAATPTGGGEGLTDRWHRRGGEGLARGSREPQPHPS